MELQDKKIFLLNITFIIAVSGIIYFTLRFMLAYLLPFLIGVIISFLIQKPADILSKKIKIKKGICAAVLSVVTYLILMLLICLIIWIFVSQGNTLINSIFRNTDMLNSIFGKLTEIINGFSDNFSNRIQLIIKNVLTDTAGGVATKAGTFLTGVATSFVKKIPAFFISTIVTVVATCYISKDFESFHRFAKNLISPHIYKNIIIIKDILFDCCFKFFSGYLLIILITFAELFFGLMLLGVEHFFLLAILISFIDVLPVLGTGIVLIPWSAILFLQENYFLAMGILILYVVVCIVRNIIEPKIIGAKIGINPLFTLLAMFLGLKLAGITGMIILPVTAIIVITFYKRQIEEEKLRTK